MNDTTNWPTAFVLAVAIVALCTMSLFVYSERQATQRRCIDNGGTWNAGTWNAGACVGPQGVP